MEFPLIFSFWIPVILCIMPSGILPNIVNFPLDFRGISAAILYKFSWWNLFLMKQYNFRINPYV